jgi:hypothetical protein
LVIGRYCWAVGRWLRIWHLEHLLQQQQWQLVQQQLLQVLDGSSSSSNSYARLSSAAACAEVSGLLEALDEAQGLLGCQAMHKIQSLWETCSINPSSGDDEDDYASIHSSCVVGGDFTRMGPKYARAWQQWQGDAGQQPVPAYGSLAAEFAQLLQGNAVELRGLCKTLVGRAHKRILALQQTISGERPSSSSSSSSSSDDPGDDIEFISAACANVPSIDEWVKAMGSVYEVSLRGWEC